MAGDIQKYCFQTCIRISGSRAMFHLFSMVSRFSGISHSFAVTAAAEHWKPVKASEAQTWNGLIR